GVHAGQRLGRGLDDDVDAVPEDVQIGVGHEHGDLDESVALLVESGHLAVDPDDAVVDGTCGAGSHRTTVSWARTQGGRGTPREVTLRSSGVDDEPPRAPGGTRDEHVPPPAAVPAARAGEVPAQH